MEYLNDLNIKYIMQKRFELCKDIKMLPFDFYLPEYNLCIEYDGIQHFIPQSFGSQMDKNKMFKKVKDHDKIKDRYCKKNGIKLLRIPYTRNKDIPTILEYSL